MRVLFCSDGLAKLRGYGLARYAEHLQLQLLAQDPSLQIAPFSPRFSVVTSIGQQAQQEWHRRVYGTFRRRTRMLRWATIGGPRIESLAGDCDIVHSVELDYPIVTDRPWVVTVHDLGPITHPEYFAKSRPWLKRRALVKAAKSAGSIVAVSNATADAIVDALGPKCLRETLRCSGGRISRVLCRRECTMPARAW